MNNNYFTVYVTETQLQHLQNALIDVNEDATHCVPLHPLYKNTGLSVDQLYAELVVREDLASIQRTNMTSSDDSHKPVSIPSDLFSKDGEPVRNVFMLGQPGYGKTTFCLHLLKLWCAAKTAVEKTGLSIWQAGMIVFNFVFYISLRHVDSCRSSIIEMICEDVFERDDGIKDVIRHVVGSLKHRCLVIVDGLDEWVLLPEAQKKLREKGLPNTKGLSANCTVLFASRHWKVNLIQPKYSKRDIVVQILGLTDNGLERIIQNILVNFFKLEIKSHEYRAKFKDLKNKIKHSEFNSSMNIPMMVTMAVFLGFDGNFDQSFMTGLALCQLELLIRRAIERGHIDTNVVNELHTSVMPAIERPQIIQQNKYVSQYFIVLYKLGKIAFNDLVSKTSHLVFNLEALLGVLGERELELSLKIGIVSQMRAPGRFHTPKVSIEFFHKSIQEAMAALYIVCDKLDGAFTSLCKYCCSLDKVMDMSNVLQYIAGISPAISCRFSEYIAYIASQDQGIIKEREEVDFGYWGRGKMLYDMLCICYQEMSHTQSLTRNADLSTRYHVTHVAVHLNNDDEKVSTACYMMRSCPGSVLSFAMSVSDTAQVSDSSVLRILRRCSNLTTLQVEYTDSTPGPELMRSISTLKNLQRVHYYRFDINLDNYQVDSDVLNVILQLPRLKHVKLQKIALDVDTLVLTDHTTQLQKIELLDVSICPQALNNFLTSMLSVKYAVDTLVYRRDKDNYNDDDQIVQGILQMPMLKYVNLNGVKLHDDMSLYIDKMKALQHLELVKIDMSLDAWYTFVASLYSVTHTADVTVVYKSDYDYYDSRIVSYILQIPKLRHVKLLHVGLENDIMVLTDQMTALQKVELWCVRMSPEAWNRFVDSLGSVKHGVVVTIEGGNIDIDCRTLNMISMSKHIIVTDNWRREHRSISFTSIPKVK